MVGTSSVSVTPVLGNGLQNRDRIEARHHDMAAACGQQGIHERTVSQMEHGGCVQANAACAHDL
jgi:hypothetical protein